MPRITACAKPGPIPPRPVKEMARATRPVTSATTIQALWVALDRLQTRMPDACDAVRLLLLTGARRSEILSLEWDWIVGSRAVLKDSRKGLARSGSTSLPAPFSMPGRQQFKPIRVSGTERERPGQGH
jgi:integrase